VPPLRFGAFLHALPLRIGPFLPPDAFCLQLAFALAFAAPKFVSSAFVFPGTAFLFSGTASLPDVKIT
jgi:hypothetical protein